ncbi:MAG: anhydro-N-acetylmuramic acid kinase [Gammaproteobacteria bacterium]|nr:anhydro-N-acetylmuramic acid kinase [Gammaproteobacteria bacterium]
MPDYYIGLMSGTSMDGIDAVAVEFTSSKTTIHASLSCPYPDNLKNQLFKEINKPLSITLDKKGVLDELVGHCFKKAAIDVIDKGNISNKDIIAIGSHGQTIRHQPNIKNPFSLQIGNAKIIANGTGITTVSNFRKADIAVGGQGAPLVPAFHKWLFKDGNKIRVIINIGGIANMTMFTKNNTETIGFDTGPGNILMDIWTRLNIDLDFDESGKWACQGSVIPELLNEFFADSYFNLSGPKSTGFEYFNLAWLLSFNLKKYNIADVQSTLCELSVLSITHAIKKYAPNAREVFICGGGAHNIELMRRLNTYSFKAITTAEIGLDPDWVEASAFAWLAMRAIKGQFGNLPSVTGASKYVVLGDIHKPTDH